MSNEAADTVGSRSLSLPRVLIVFIVLLMFAALWLSASPYRPYWLQQRQLAGELGVKPGDYPVPEMFPVGYFRARLQPGMPAAEVQTVVRGYEAAYRCDADGWDVYYYFSGDEARALRFVIAYDRDLHFEYLGTEDANQRTISIEGCIAGRLGE